MAKPATLKDVLTLPNQRDYEIKIGYWLEIGHELMGNFPAIIKNTSNVVLAFDIDLLKTVWKLLPPRRSKINRDTCYVNESTGIAFILSRWENSNSMLTAQRLPILTEDKFTELTKQDPQPFEWEPGLMGAHIEPEQFQQHVEREIAQLKQCSPR